MILRNKKTGKIWHMPRLRQPTVQEDDISFFACIGEHGCVRGELFSYKSLAELNADWEDVEPAEPLIKDEKIRKAVKAWADANNVTEVEYDKAVDTFVALHKPAKIKFNDSLGLNANDWAILTISELCGEGE